MEDPWEKLNSHELPEYSLYSGTGVDETYTNIEIVGFRSGEGFSAGKLTYNRINHYINWKTIGGSLAHRLAADPHEMEIRVELDDVFDDTRNELVQQSRFEFPQERTDLQRLDDIESACKHYPYRQRTVEVNGREVTYDIVGFVAGKEAREELPTYGRHSTQFGIWLAKDHIKVERVPSVVGSDHETPRFFFVANCQELELSANRETVRNKSSALFDALVSDLKRFLDRVVEDPWYREYLAQRKTVEIEESADEAAGSIQDRIERARYANTVSVSNSHELIARCTEYASSGGSFGQIVDFDSTEDIEAIVEKGGEYRAVALTPSLHDLFVAERAVREADQIICWEYGDLDILRQIEVDGYLGRDIQFVLSAEEPYCELDGERIPVLSYSNVSRNIVTTSAGEIWASCNTSVYVDSIAG
ncbi:ATP-binding protein [Halobaculum halobium]|uniref:ATP-binding protein n=1 Tax=Halobaculum halobium TaxID=3032281 RepID=UPI003608460D